MIGQGRLTRVLQGGLGHILAATSLETKQKVGNVRSRPVHTGGEQFESADLDSPAHLRLRGVAFFRGVWGAIRNTCEQLSFT